MLVDYFDMLFPFLVFLYSVAHNFMIIIVCHELQRAYFWHISISSS